MSLASDIYAFPKMAYITELTTNRLNAVSLTPSNILHTKTNVQPRCNPIIERQVVDLQKMNIYITPYPQEHVQDLLARH